MDRERNSPDKPPLVGLEEVRLSVPTEAIYRAIYPQRFKPEVMRWADDQPLRPTLTEFLARRRDRLSDPTCLERIIFFRGEPVGTVTAFGVDQRSQSCEMGIVIITPDRWGRGIGSRAIELFFKPLRSRGILRIYLETFEDNWRAQAAFQRVGFQVIRRYWDRGLERHILVMSYHLDEGEA